MFGKSYNWWFGKNSLFGKVSGISHLQDRSSDWWFGKNSLFASAIGSTKYGKSNGSGLGEAELLKYGIILGAFILLFKK